LVFVESPLREKRTGRGAECAAYHYTNQARRHAERAADHARVPNQSRFGGAFSLA
jgi:hypothetical protein